MTMQAIAHAPPPVEGGAEIPCADCLHCKVFKEFERTGRYILKVRCAKAHWRRGKSNRLAATFDLHTLLNRHVEVCDDYDSISEDAEDRRQYLESLAEDLPVERHIYEPDGSFVDLEELARCHDDI